MVFKDKENRVEKLLSEHFEKVRICLDDMQKVMEAYLEGKIDVAKSYALNVDHTEAEADSVRRRIAKELYRGAFLPALREDLSNFVEAVDKIADGAESCCDFIMLQRVEVPQELKQRFKEISKDSVASFTPLIEAYGLLYKDFSAALKKVHEVAIKEEKVDQQEWELTRIIFKSELELAHKIQLDHFILRITTISDRAEDASDKLEILIIKRQV